MASPYQEFVRKARERFEESKKRRSLPRGGMQFTLHARFKMNQYGLSEQRVRGVIRNPKRTERGIVPKTTAVMQPVSPKQMKGKETWKQEIWVMYMKQKNKISEGTGETLRIISAWRYPGVSPKGNPIPEEILQELLNGSIL